MNGDYRIFAGAFPRGELADRIQELRSRLDPKTARITPPHVTMAGTYWRTGPATPENEALAIASLAAIQRQIESFDLVLGGVRSFLPQAAVIYLHVEPTPGLLAARQALLAALGADKHGARFTPHLTLAMRLDQQSAEAALADLQRSEWHSGRWVVRMDALHLMQRGPQDPAWRAIHRLDLGR